MLKVSELTKSGKPVSWGILFIALAAIGVTANLVIPYYLSTPVLPISQDSLKEFYLWTRGEDIWAKARHNGAGSLFVGIHLAMDVYIGPYGFWLRLT